MMKIKKGDTVKVIAGKDKDKEGKVLSVDAKNSKVVVEGVNYEQMRLYRAEIEYREKPVFGRSLAHTMLFDSNLKNFAGLLDYTITFYELTNFDEAELGFVRLPDLEDKK